jgi:hypothetical protein
MPMTPKPAALRQRRNKRNEVGLLALDAMQVMPEPSSNWLKATRDEWEAYWSSSVSSLVDRRSELLGPVTRMFDYKDEHARALREFRRQRTVLGSTGQMRLSPHFDAMKSLSNEIFRLESVFGLNSLSRLRLGAELGSAHKSLAEMNAALERGDDDDEETVESEVIDLPGLPNSG